MLLTIGIYTYNRASYLKQNLLILFPQLLKYRDNVEVIISDNASTDDTVMVVNEAVVRYSFPVIFNVQKDNVGAEGNGLWVIKHATGKYLFLLGDDDILADNFMDTIMPYLSSPHNYDAIHWNRLSGDSNCDNNILCDSHFVGNTVEELTANEFIRRVLEKPNFISSIIFKRKMVIDNWNYYRDCYDGYKFCGPLYWGIALSEGLNLYHYMPLVIQRNPSKTWEKYWPLYFIGSMSNLFCDLDAKVPGIYNIWAVKLRKEVSGVIPSISFYRNIYRLKQVRSQILNHLVWKEKIFYYFYLLPGSYFFYRIKSKILRFLISVFS